MTDSHEWQSLNFNGTIVQSCKWCFAPMNSPQGKESCTGRSKIEKEIVELAVKPPVLLPNTMTASVIKTPSVADLIRSLNVADIEGLIVELEGEVAGLKVLLAAAKARDMVKEKQNDSIT